MERAHSQSQRSLSRCSIPPGAYDDINHVVGQVFEMAIEVGRKAFADPDVARGDTEEGGGDGPQLRVDGAEQPDRVDRGQVVDAAVSVVEVVEVVETEESSAGPVIEEGVENEQSTPIHEQVLKPQQVGAALNDVDVGGYPWVDP